MRASWTVGTIPATASGPAQTIDSQRKAPFGSAVDSIDSQSTVDAVGRLQSTKRLDAL
jgi:hypothetical protein